MFQGLYPTEGICQKIFTKLNPETMSNIHDALFTYYKKKKCYSAKIQLGDWLNSLYYLILFIYYILTLMNSCSHLFVSVDINQLLDV